MWQKVRAARLSSSPDFTPSSNGRTTWRSTEPTGIIRAWRQAMQNTFPLCDYPQIAELAPRRDGHRVWWKYLTGFYSLGIFLKLSFLWFYIMERKTDKSGKRIKKHSAPNKKRSAVNLLNGIPECLVLFIILLCTLPTCLIHFPKEKFTSLERPSLSHFVNGGLIVLRPSFCPIV
jgi:hypothetical protein